VSAEQREAANPRLRRCLGVVFTAWFICISDELSLPCWGSSGCRALLGSASPIFLLVSYLCVGEVRTMN